MGKEFLIEAASMKVVEKAEGEGKFALISSPDDLAAQFEKADLVKLRTNLRGKAAEADEKKSVKKLAGECFMAMDKGGEKKKSAAKKDKAPKKPSKMDTIVATLQEKKTITRPELAAIIGSDEANTHTMISILKSPKRTKEPILVDYDKGTKTYTFNGMAPVAK